jgi:hypothetical protein
MWIIKKDTVIPLCNNWRSDRKFMPPRVIALILTLLFSAGSFSCGRQEVTERNLPKNSRPQIVSVKILPENPNKESVFNLVIESYDPDHERVAYRYQWLKNGEEMEGENKEVLRGTNLKKGDLIRVKVTPSDGKMDGEPFLSAPVRILNSPPVIQEIWIEPKLVYVNDNLKVHVKSNDADGDPVHYTYRWEKNGIALNEERGEILERGRFKKGDSVAVTAVPNDGETSGTLKKSEPIMIANSPPIITSSPATETDGNIYTYQVTTNHPDNDPIVFTLKTAPKGMEIDRETGLIRWEIRKGDQGTHPIEIEASDGEGAKCFQRYTLSVEFR